METLSQKETRAFFGSDEGYTALERHWSALVNSPDRKSLRPEHYLLYQALRGKDWRKGFAPLTNPCKLQNGAFYNWGLYHALRRLHSSWAQEKLLEPFHRVVDVETLEKVRAVLPKQLRSFEIAQAYEVTQDVSQEANQSGVSSHE
jgi:hypothetical protein